MATAKYLAGLRGIHEKIAADMPALSHIECMTCGQKAPHDFARHLKNGWPKCCGYTMRLLTVREVEEASRGDQAAE